MNILKFAQFDESQFKPRQDQACEYVRCVYAGYERMRDRSVAIAGLARNVEQILPATILRIELLGKKFRDYSVIIYENDSTDGTRELLENWRSINNRVHIISETLDAPVNRPIRCSSRASRMAYYRSCVHRYIVTNFPYSDNVLLLDTDLIGGWSPDGVANTFGKDDWDFVGSNGMIYKRLGLNNNYLAHYDAWAYRLDKEMTSISTSQVNAINHNRGEPLVPLASCFGGLGIYTREAFACGKYEGEDIEHVGFHRSLISAGYDRLFLNPSQIVIYGRKHRKFDKFIPTLRTMSVLCRIFGIEPCRYPSRVDFSDWKTKEFLKLLESTSSRGDCEIPASKAA